MPVDEVRRSCEQVVRCARSVRVDAARAEELARELLARAPPVWTEDVHALGADADEALRVHYLLMLDAMNFCFWPSEGDAPQDGGGRAEGVSGRAPIEYDDLARGLARACRERAALFASATGLAALSEEQLREALGARCALPEMGERARLLREIGAGLLRFFGGSAATMVASARGSATELVRIVAAHFPGFRDTCIYGGRQVALYKRAQIFVADVWGSLQGRGLGHFDDIGRLTMFADYRVPQLLAHRGVLVYEDALARRIAKRDELLAGEPAEVEIRAATVVAVERVREAMLAATGSAWLSVQIDWALWQIGEEASARGALGEHHRCRTIFY